MIGLDTNILVRYLTRDDEQQWHQAVNIIQQNRPCFITNIVLCELVWVLRGANHSLLKDEIINALESMLHSTAFEFENRSTTDATFDTRLIVITTRAVGCVCFADKD